MKPTLVLIALFCCGSLLSQRIVFPGQEQLYPYFNDPSALGLNDRVELTGMLQVSDAERKQTSQYILAQMPIYDNIAFGVDYFRDRFDFFSYSSAMLGASIRFDLGSRQQYVKLGFSGGVETRQQERIPVGQLPTDVDFVPNINMANRSFTFRGGLHYNRNNFTLGGFYNRMPIQEIVRTSDPEALFYDVAEGYTGYVQYKIQVAQNFRLTPIFRYLSYLDDPIYEGVLRLDVKNWLSASVSYKNEYSINPAIQVYLLDALNIGYSYETSIDDLFDDVHALSLSYRFKKRAGEDGPEWQKNAEETSKKIADLTPTKKKKTKKRAEKKKEPAVVADTKTSEVIKEPVEKPAPKTEKEQPKKPTLQVASQKAPEKPRVRTIDRTVDAKSKLLKTGYYVVIGSFASLAEAEKAQTKFKEQEYYTIIGKKGTNSRYYLIVDTDTDKQEAIKRLRAHKLDRNFKDPWLMTVE